MWAALRLRLTEARRRGGLWLLGASVIVIGWVAIAGGDTPDGRYGLASDLAATFTYLAALAYGAFPLAIDRERRRSYLPGASPVRPAEWALGNALGAAVIAFVTGLLLFAAAGIGGGIETYAFTRMEAEGVYPLDLRIPVPEDATRLRLVPRVQVNVEETVGTTDAAPIEVDGETYWVHDFRPIVVPIESNRPLLRNLSKDHIVSIVAQETRALGARRPFLLNALLAGAAPSLGAAALAAVAATGGALLSAPVAALLTALVLLLASMKGFLLDTFEHEGEVQRVRSDGDHAHEFDEGPGVAREAARGVIEGVLLVLPNASELDRTDRVALGDWTGLKGSGRALLILCGALAVALVLGGVGVHRRRLP
ncbi:MAG: hypothetical protein ACYSX0_17225 [Planctomycetota bacterium]